MYQTVKVSDIDLDRLRNDLMDHYGTATGFFPMAFMDVSKVQDASAQELVDMAEDAGIDVTRYLRR
jgi:hypothetical protein